MTNLQTDAKLLRALEWAANVGSSADELREQRVSFIVGAMKASSTVTRAQIQEALAKHEGATSTK